MEPRIYHLQFSGPTSTLSYVQAETLVAIQSSVPKDIYKLARAYPSMQGDAAGDCWAGWGWLILGPYVILGTVMS